jgi:hypothetical protein
LTVADSFDPKVEHNRSKPQAQFPVLAAFFISGYITNGNKMDFSTRFTGEIGFFILKIL